MKSYLLKLFGFGLLTWLIPFIVSFAFFDVQTQEMTVSETFFKTIMIITGALTGVILMVIYFRKVTKMYIAQGLIIGLVWLAINWVLDLLMVWRGFFDMTYVQYFQDIGLRYLSLPIYSVGVGVMLDKVASSKFKVQNSKEEKEDKKEEKGGEDGEKN